MNWNYKKSHLHVRPEHKADHDARILKLENEQKLLLTRLNRGIYKSVGDFNRAWSAQQRSFQRIIKHRDQWQEPTSKHPHVNREREEESDRFIEKALMIQKKYDNIISVQAQKQGVCDYLTEEKTCNQGNDCYWFDKKNVDGKDIGCYSEKETRKNWVGRQPIKRSIASSLDTITENHIDTSQRIMRLDTIEGEEKEEKKEPNFFNRSSSSYPDRGGGRKKKTRRKRKKKTRRRRKYRKTKRRKSRRTA